MGHTLQALVTSYHRHFTPAKHLVYEAVTVICQPDATLELPGGELLRSHWPVGIFFSLHIYLFIKYLFMYISTLQLSSDTSEEGMRYHYRWL